MKRNAGFTLIELVIVIVILGILAVTAAPKFISMQSEARSSVVKALSGSVRSVTDMVHAKAIVAGRDQLAASTVSIDGSNRAIVYGYPNAATLLALLDINRTANGNGTATNGNAAEWGSAASNTNYVFWPSGTATTAAAAITANCYVQYTPATSATTAPVITAIVTGC